MKEVLIALIVMAYNAAILFGIGYAVFVLEYSGWWFLLALLFMANIKSH